MLRWARRVDDDGTEAAARRHLDWVASRQRSNGWFDDCVFKPGTAPSTHGLAYTLRGLLESYAIAGSESWLAERGGTHVGDAHPQARGPAAAARQPMTRTGAPPLATRA